MMRDVMAGDVLLNNVGGIDSSFRWFKIVVMGIYQYIDKMKFFPDISVSEEVLENEELMSWIETFPSLTPQDCDEETYRQCRLLWDLIHNLKKSVCK